MTYATHQIVWSMAGVFSVLASILTFYLIYGHLRNYTAPRFQKPIVRILLMIPIYAIDSWLSLLFFRLSVFFDVARDCYEAYAIYEFFVLLMQFMDGEETLVAVLDQKPAQGHPWPFCFLPKFKTGKGFYLLCKRCVLQFVVVKPILSASTMVMELFGVYHEGSFSFKSGYLYITAIDNVSITIAVYFLVLFYMPIEEELKPFRPVPKFLCIKTVIFFSFWQGVLLAFLVWVGAIQEQEGWTVDNLSSFIQDALICVEMFLLSLALGYAFGYEEYLDPDAGLFKPVLRNIRSVVSVKDVVNDTVDTFGGSALRKPTQENEVQPFGHFGGDTATSYGT